jgi:hypothetical protein
MSQAGIVNSSAVSSVFVETLTPNSGGAVAGVSNNINVLGLAANAGANAYPIFSYNGGSGLFNIADNTYFTPYVVDGSSTPGREGTFTNVQAAVTQAVADSNAGLIYVRPGYYPQTVTIPSGAKIAIVGLANLNQYAYIGTFGPVLTNLVVSSTAQLYLQNMLVSSSVGTALSNVAGYVYAQNCGFGSLSFSFDTTSAGSSTSVFFNCGSGTLNVGGSSSVTFNNGTIASPNQVFVSQTSTFTSSYTTIYQLILANSGIISCDNCNITGSVTGSSSARQFFFYNTFQTGSSASNNPTANVTSYGNVSTTGTVYGANPTVTTLTAS